MGENKKENFHLGQMMKCHAEVEVVYLLDQDLKLECLWVILKSEVHKVKDFLLSLI